jgi:alkaline phosphatase
VRKYLVLLPILFAAAVCTAAERRAKNVILFLGDAGGIPTLNATSLYRYGAPQKLFIQQMPHIALSDTSAADAWVTDSAAGMTAIVTGQKTNNGVISQSAAAVRGKQDGEILQTILEHAEQRGLSTGVMTNMVITDATPAACYAHVNDRKMAGEIFAQVLHPRFGDGVDVLIGAGRDTVRNATTKLGIDIDPALRAKGYAVRESPDEISPRDRRVVALLNTSDFALWPAVEKALRILEKNPKGFFLMVEWDTHTDDLRRGLDHAAELDEVIRKTAASMKGDTLILFAADHSFDLRLRGGKPGQPLVVENAEPGGTPAKKPAIRVDNSHTGEEVLVSALGPGSERVQGFIPNTRLFEIMMAAYGWR